MRKRVFLFIVILMTIALIGIISVQVFWIQQTVQIKEAQFTENVRFSLAKVSEDIKLREFEEFYLDISEKYKDQGKKYAYADVRKYVFEKIDTASNERFTYSQSIVEANYKVPLAFTDTDSVGFKEIFGMEEFVRTKDPLVDNLGDLEPVSEKKLLRLGRFEEAEKSYLENIFDVYTAEVPIHKRVSNREINLRLGNELALRGIQTPFKYGIYNNGLATRVKSGYFTKETGKSYKVNMFSDAEGMSDYQLYVTFPEKETFIIASIAQTLLLSALFILIIMLAFGVSLYQLVRQKKIAEIKGDFINNMTHEFKTPIATINLALDAIKNPKIINDAQKVTRYIEMIREENNRMNVQVENVLRVSKLDKKQLDVHKEPLHIHDVIAVAVSHVTLLVRKNDGHITEQLSADSDQVFGSRFHLTNALVNIFDNAIKYSADRPEISIFTEIVGKNIIISVKDRGIGMHKSVQKNIFDKFYREEGGDVHNVKGHGLGLSYVKGIVDIHKGTVSVASQPGLGSTFTIHLPLLIDKSR